MPVILVFALQPSKIRYIQRCDTCSQMPVQSDDTHEHIGREDQRGEREEGSKGKREDEEGGGRIKWMTRAEGRENRGITLLISNIGRYTSHLLIFEKPLRLWWCLSAQQGKQKRREEIQRGEGVEEMVKMKEV